ncbi:hypothetical protein [Streptomyces mirabilis]
MVVIARRGDVHAVLANPRGLSKAGRLGLEEVRLNRREGIG